MTNRRKPATQQKQRETYPSEFKVEAVKLANTVGATEAARQLKLQTSQIYSWRASIARKESSSKAESRLLAENAALKRQLAEQKEEMAFLKKSVGVCCKTAEVKYAFINEHSDRFAVKRQCRWLGVARSAFYDWRQRQAQPNPRHKRRQQIDQAVLLAFDQRKHRYSSPRLTLDLNEAGFDIAKNTVARSMQRRKWLLIIEAS